MPQSIPQIVQINFQAADVTNLNTAFTFAYPTLKGLTVQQQAVQILQDFIAKQLNTQAVVNAQIIFNNSVSTISPIVTTLS